MQNIPICLRQATADDISFVFHSWLKSYYELGFSSRGVSPAIYFKSQHVLISAILQHSTILIAAPEGDDLTILGFVVFGRIEGQAAIHYAYVKAAFRRAGIGGQLMNTARSLLGERIMATHLTELGRHILKDTVYNPYLLQELPIHGSKTSAAAHHAARSNQREAEFVFRV